MATFEKYIYRGHITDLPPSIASVCPVIKDASSDAKNAIVFAINKNKKQRYT